VSQFRKKPIVIEAEQFRERDAPLPFNLERVCCYSQQTGWYVMTLEGPLHISDGDWIIRGIAGEFYPCKPDIFAATYEPAEGSEPAAASVPLPPAASGGTHTCDGGMNPPFPGECLACGREAWEATDIKALTERIAGFIASFQPQVQRTDNAEHRAALNSCMWDLKTAIYLLTAARLLSPSPAPTMIDIPLAWKLTRETSPEQHHERCSYRTAGMLCDCAAFKVMQAVSGWLKAEPSPAPPWAEGRTFPEIRETIRGQEMVWDYDDLRWKPAMTPSVSADRKERT
jgi:hypothetical protein